MGQAASSDTGSAAPHVVIAGAGIVGVCCGLQLQLAGARVTVLDPEPPGSGASYGNGGVIGQEHVVPVATPGVLRQAPRMLLDPTSPLSLRWRSLPRLAPWLARFLASARPGEVERISKALATLLDGAIDAFTPLLRAADAESLLHRTGWLCVYETAAGFEGARGALDLQRRRGVPHEVVPAAELHRLEPSLAPAERFHAGVYYPDVAYVDDPHRLVRALAQALEARGGAIRRERVQDVELGPGGAEAVVTERGRHPCDRLVVAAGAWSRPLARRLGTDLPLDTERGYHLQLPREAAVRPRLPVYSTERGQVCTPLAAGLRLAGTVELASLEAPADWRRADLLLANARRWFPEIDGRGAQRWLGFRPSMPDSLPVIARAPKVANAVLAFGHGHCGLMLGARTGELVRDLVLDRPPEIDVAPFRADRF